MNTKRMRNLVLVGALLVGVSACGSDDKKDSSDTTAAASADTGASTDTAASGESSGNPDVVEYCNKTKELAESLKALIADPTKGDVAAVTADATALITAAAGLTSANPDDADEIAACSQTLSTALTGG